MEARLGVGATEQTFVFPYHLIALMESQGTLYFRFDPGVLYETAYSKQEFLNFYRRLGQYTVTERGMLSDHAREGERIRFR